MKEMLISSIASSFEKKDAISSSNGLSISVVVSIYKQSTICYIKT